MKPGGITAAAFLAVLAAACVEPASYEQFVRAGDSASGPYVFELPLTDTLAAYDLSFYTAPPKRNLRLEVSWSGFAETVYYPAGKSSALYRSEVRPERTDFPSDGTEPGSFTISVLVPEPPADFRGLGMICSRKKDGTR